MKKYAWIAAFCLTGLWACSGSEGGTGDGNEGSDSTKVESSAITQDEANDLKKEAEALEAEVEAMMEELK